MMQKLLNLIFSGSQETTLSKMKKNYSSYNQTEIRQYALDTFSADIICDKLYNIYKKILDR